MHTEVKPVIKHLTLLIPEKAGTECAAIMTAWLAEGGRVIPIGHFWEPLHIPLGARVYGDHVFCHVLAQTLGLQLISPADDLLLNIDPLFLKRKIQRSTLDHMRRIAFPCFAKPLIPKIFRGRVFESPFELEEECRQLPSQTGIIYSEIVKFNCKVRAFIFRGRVMTMAVYGGEGNPEDAKVFLHSFIQVHNGLLPVSYVTDVGYIEGRGWAVIEFSPAWGTELNGCDAKEAVFCIAEASRDENE